MTFTQHVERPKIKNSCHHHQVNFSYLWVVVVVSSCGSINIKILFVWKKNKRYVFVLQITCCMSDIKKNRESIFITPPPLPPKNILRPKTERERGNLFFNLILEGLVLCIIIHFSFEYALYSLTFLLSLSCCIFFCLWLLICLMGSFCLWLMQLVLGWGGYGSTSELFFLLFFFNALLIMMLFSFLSTSAAAAAAPLPALPPVVAA